MKANKPPKNVISLTSEQIGDVLARGFWNFLDSTKKYYREDKSANVGILGDKTEGRVSIKQVGPPCFKGINCEEQKKGAMLKMKGHAPIRSQTGHDHDRNHKKY